jgi:DNA-binding transcriptional regulator YhcF (GntR family)
LYTVPGKGIFVASQEMGEIRTIAKNQLEEAMQDAKNAGVSKSCASEIVNKIWGDEE